MSTKIYPFELPPGVHPLSWTLLGFGLDGKTASAIARHLFDDLGARINLEPAEPVTVGFAVDWPLRAGEKRRASVGDVIDEEVASSGAVRIVAGHLPPGVTLERHTGRLVGRIREPGLYEATIAVGPVVKYDPLGGSGLPDEPGLWIPVDRPRETPTTALNEFPATVEDLDDAEKSRLLSELQAWQNGVTAKEADGGD